MALGHRELRAGITLQEIRDMSREELERDLKFVGFVSISCPLKPDSKSAIKEILNASHSVVMITGDNPLTACHVSRELEFTEKDVTLILTNFGSSWSWQSVDQSEKIPLGSENVATKGKEIWNEYTLCMTGEVRSKKLPQVSMLKNAFTCNYNWFFFFC